MVRDFRQGEERGILLDLVVDKLRLHVPAPIPHSRPPNVLLSQQNRPFLVAEFLREHLRRNQPIPVTIRLPFVLGPQVSKDRDASSSFDHHVLRVLAVGTPDVDWLQLAEVPDRASQRAVAWGILQHAFQVILILRVPSSQVWKQPRVFSPQAHMLMHVEMSLREVVLLRADALQVLSRVGVILRQLRHFRSPSRRFVTKSGGRVTSTGAARGT